MSCKHRFYGWLTLPENLVNWEVETLIVGTFNPAWNSENQNAPWFYGRTFSNAFWGAFPLFKGNISLRNTADVSDWLQFCRTYGIAFTDLVSKIINVDRSNPVDYRMICSFADEFIQDKIKASEVNFTDVIQILKDRPSIKRVFLTRSTGSPWGKLWTPVARYCAGNGIYCRDIYTPSQKSGMRKAKKQMLDGEDYENFLLRRWKRDGLR